MEEYFEISIPVFVLGGKEKKLRIIYQDDILTFTIEGKQLFTGDWNDNFYEVFSRFIELFGHNTQA